MPTGQFSCDACGKTYAWKAQLAGKKVKCKCGSPISVPAEDPALAEAPPPEFEDLYALAQGEDVPVAPPPIARAVGAPVLAAAGAAPDLAPAPKAPRKGGVRSAGGGGGGAPAAAGGRPKMLGYAQMGGGRRRLGDDDRDKSGDVFFNPVKDVYIPAGLILLGTGLLFFVMMHDRGLDAGTAVVAVGILSVINLILIVPAILLTVRLFDLGVGPIGPAVVKLAACALAPGAIGETIKLFFTGSAGGYIGACISLAITFTIFMKLLDMDFMETLTCACIIWVIRTWLIYLLLGAIFSTGSMMSAFSGGIGAIGTAGAGRIMLSGEIDPQEDESLDGIRAKQSDEDALGILASPGGVDGKEWLEAQPNRVVGKQTREKSLEIMRGYYQAGIKEVRVYPAGKNDKGEEVVSMMIVCPLDNDKAARERVVEHSKKLAKHLKRVAYRDRGERYIIVRMTTADEDITAAGGGGGGGAAPAVKAGKKPAGEDEDSGGEDEE